MCNAAKRPWPQLDPDEVIDYLIMEAVATRATQEDRELEKKRETERWKKDKSSLEHMR